MTTVPSQCWADGSYEVFTPEQYREYFKQSYPGLLEGEDEYEDSEDNITEFRRQIENKGYYDTFSDNAVSLMAMKKKKATKPVSLDEDPYYARLRESASEMPLSFPFFSIASINSGDLLGYAPSASVEQNGDWTGITGYFNHVDFGTCRIIIFDYEIGRGKSFYDERYTSYEINNKPTSHSVVGSNESGFLYSVSWNGKHYSKMLECANNNPFNAETMSKFINFARVIDEEVIDTP